MRFRLSGWQLALLLFLAAAAGAASTLLLWRGEASGWTGIGARPPDRPAGDATGWSAKELEKLNRVLELVEKRYLFAPDRERLLDGAIQGMLESLGDPYSVYMSAGEAAQYADSLQGAFTGIGAELMIEKGHVVVVAPITGSPAEKAGLKPKDILLSVNGEPLQGLSLHEAVKKIRGPKGTKAKLRVLRPGTEGELELELVRDRIELETVRSELDADGVGRLWISQFTSDTFRRVREELEKLEAGGMRALVIDLRNNPGGILTTVVAVAELFVPRGKTIVIYEDGAGVRQEERSRSQLSSPKPYPIVVLVNGGSASSAEVLAGALQQSAGAVLVGETTYGKGTIQMNYERELGDGSLVKLTVYKWLLPDGTWVNGRGIRPDVEVRLPAWFSAPRLPRDRVLELDQAGDDVRILQLILGGLDLPAGRNDGYFDRSTRESVRTFQQREGLPVTGQVDEATADRLEEALYLKMLDPQHDTQWMTARRIALETAGAAAPGRGPDGEGAEASARAGKGMAAPVSNKSEVHGRLIA